MTIGGTALQDRWKSIVAFVIGVVVGTFAMELGVRLVEPQQLVRGYAVPDPELGTYVAPNQAYLDLYGGRYLVRTNGAAFRMEEEVDMSLERRRILVYGDSFTFGWGLDYADTYFAALKEAAERADPSLQILNAAVGGYSTGHVKKLLERHIPALQPAAVVYFFNNNDLTDNAITDIDYRVTEYRVRGDGGIDLKDVKPFSPWKRFLLNYTPYGWLNRNSHVFVLSKDLLKRALNWKRRLQIPRIDDASAEPKPASSEANPATPQLAYTVRMSESGGTEDRINRFVAISVAHVRRLAGLAEKAGLPLLVIWVPAQQEMFPPGKETAVTRLLVRGRQALSELGRQNGSYTFVDTTEIIPRGANWSKRKGTLSFSDGHFNAAGAAWFGQLTNPAFLEFLSQELPVQ